MKKDVLKHKSTPLKQPGVQSQKAAPVGYRHPPVEHRWKKGESGNPAGPPKKKLTKSVLRAFVEEVLLGDQVTLRGPDGTSTRQVPKLHALLIKLSNCSLEGDHRIAKLLLAFVEKLAVEGVGPATAEDDEEDVAILRRHGILPSAEADDGAEDGAVHDDEGEPPNDSESES